MPLTSWRVTAEKFAVSVLAVVKRRGGKARHRALLGGVKEDRGTRNFT